MGLQRIPDHFISALLSQCDMLALATRRGVEFKKAGAEYTAVCPFHNEKSGSFTYSPRKQMFHCFGCGKNFNAIQYVMAADGLPFRDAIEVLAGETGMQMPVEMEVREDYSKLYGALAKAVLHYRATLKNHPEVLDYLYKRGIADEAIERFEIGFADDEQKQAMFDVCGCTLDDAVAAGLMRVKEGAGRKFPYNVMRGRIIFPIQDARGRTIALGGRHFGEPDSRRPKYMNTPESAIYNKGRTLFGVPQAMRNNREHIAMVVEGYVDAVALTMAGIPGLASCGTAVTESHIREVCRLGVNTIYMGMDGDAAGVAATEKAVNTALPVMPNGKALMIVELPEGKDPDEIMLEQGRSAMLKMMDRARYPSEVIVGRDLTTPELRAAAVDRLKELVGRMPEGSLREQLELQAKELRSGIRGRALHRPRTTREGLTSGERLVALLLDLPDARKAEWLKTNDLPAQTAEAVQLLQQNDAPAAVLVASAPSDMAAWLERLSGYHFDTSSMEEVEAAFQMAVYDALRERAQNLGAYELVERLSALQDRLTSTDWVA